MPSRVRSENAVVDDAAAAAPRFLMVAVTAKLSPATADGGGLVSAVTTRSGMLAAGTAPGLPRNRLTTTARPHAPGPNHCLPRSVMTCSSSTGDFVQERRRQGARQARGLA